MGTVLVTGATGFVGGNVAAQLAAGGVDVVCAVRRDPGPDFPWPWRLVDLASAQQLSGILREIQATAVVHLAIGATFDQLLANRRAGFDGYVGMTRSVVDAANSAGAVVSYVSTDWVFDGTGHAVPEDEPVNPVNLYGMFKALSERVVLDRAERGFVARVGAVQAVNLAAPDAPTQQSCGFGNLGLAVVDSVARGVPTTVWEGAAANEIASPITAAEIGSLLLAALEVGADGVLHLVGPEALSRMGLARIACQAFGLDASLLRRGRVPETARLSERVPYDTSLSSPRTEAVLGRSARPILDQLIALREQLGR